MSLEQLHYILGNFQRNLDAGAYDNLTAIGIDLPWLGDRHTDKVVDFLLSQPKITRVNVHNNDITDRSAEQIARLVEDNPAITELNLSGNYLTSTGMEAIEKSIRCNNNIIRFVSETKGDPDTEEKKQLDMLLEKISQKCDANKREAEAGADMLLLGHSVIQRLTKPQAEAIIPRKAAVREIINVRNSSDQKTKEIIEWLEKEAARLGVAEGCIIQQTPPPTDLSSTSKPWGGRLKGDNGGDKNKGFGGGDPRLN